MRVLPCVGALALAGCRLGGTASDPGVTRLVDLYRPDTVETRAATTAARPSAEWRFTATAGKPFWQAGPGLTGLTVREGRLAGRASAEIPIVGLERPRVEDRDVVHEVHVRLRVSAGSNLAATFRTTETVDLAAETGVLGVIPWPFNTPLVPGNDVRTYVMRTTASVPAAARHVLIRPTDAAGATFEIESVRVVTRREHLAGVASGLAWQGLSDVYRETLVARSPEKLRFEIELPSHPRLELAVGTIEEGPVTFRVAVQTAGEAGETHVLERTVTSAHRWESATADLARFGGRKATLSLTVAAQKPGTLGFWGTPVVRQVPASADGPAKARRPQGVILVWADTLRRDHLEMYGYGRPTAPILTAMAKEGALFEDCIAQASWTKASGPAIVTSLYPTSHRVQSFNDVLPSSATTMAEVYRQAGYATLGLISIQFVGKFSNMHQGFEELHEPGSFPELQTGSLKSARAQVDRLLPWLHAHRDVPFFVLLHVRDPHSPHRPHAPYDTLWADAARRPEHEKQAEAVKPFIRNPLMRRFGMPTRDELGQAGIDADAYVAYEKDWYDGSIRAMDTELGRLWERLKELGLDRRTLVAFLADHGEEFLEHGRMFHQQSIYGELANVPLFLWWPGTVPGGVRVPETVQNIDVMPTLLELSGLAAPAGIQGASLSPLFRSPRPAWTRPAIIEGSGRPDPTATDADAWAIVHDGWKLVNRPKPPAGRPAFELYDRRTDPLDGTDVAARHPDVVARLARELEAWRSMATQARLKPDAEAVGQMNAEDLERLRALGYVQ